MDDLLRAYQASIYEIDDPHLTIRPGETNPRLDELLAGEGLQTWAFITAWNPQSKPLGGAENDAAQARLLERVRHHHIWIGRGRSVDATWQEDSLLIGGITAQEAKAIGREFDQRAILLGVVGEPARLVDLGTGDP